MHTSGWITPKKLPTGDYIRYRKKYAASYYILQCHKLKQMGKQIFDERKFNGKHTRTHIHKTTTTYKNRMRTPAVKCEITDENKTNIEETDQKENKNNLKYMRSFWRALRAIYTWCSISNAQAHNVALLFLSLYTILAVFSPSFPFQQILTNLMLTNTLRECSTHAHIHHVYYDFCDDLLLMHWMWEWEYELNSLCIQM